jgi:aminoglycoside 3-N-acetyltransferase
MDSKQYIPYTAIARTLGIKAGDVVLLTSDILRLAIKARKTEGEFSPGNFIDSFLEALGSEGTLLLPAYNFDLEPGDRYDILKTVPMTGSLAVSAMHRDDFVRTAHPLHSFLVAGKDASLLAGMNNISSFGPDSPFAWMHEKNALMVFAGTTPADAMTFVHFVEEHAQVGYRNYRDIPLHYTDREGRASERTYRLYAKKAGYTMMLHRLPGILEDEILRKEMINGIPFSCVRCRDVYEAVGRDIRENKAASIAGFSTTLYFRDIIKQCLSRFNIFRTNYGRIRSGKRIR